jgi:N-acetylmuramoyl-L-alanine amidase CwlD
MKVFSIKKESIIFVICMGIILANLINSIGNETKPTFSMPLSNKIILIDAGHGGWDPGKVADNNIFEKDINLEIAKKLQEYLEQSGAFVFMTRVEDEALSDKKVKDMIKRKEISNSTSADMMISIHQNSFSQEKVKGAQVFYYKESESGKKLAEFIQTEIKKNIDENNNRVAKTNSDYYILRKIKIPSVIVECGFLSNNNELEKLTSNEYQNKIAWAIYLGILDYYSQN